MIKTKRIHLQPRGTTRGRCGLLPNYWRRSSGWTNYDNITFIWQKGIKGKGFPYSIPSVGPEAYPDVQAVSPSPGGRLTLLSARLAVTFPAAEHHCPLAGTKLYCFVTEAHRCEQLAQGCYAVLPWVGYEPTTCWSQVQRSTRCATFIWLSDAKNCTTDTNKAAITDHVAEKKSCHRLVRCQNPRQRKSSEDTTTQESLSTYTRRPTVWTEMGEPTTYLWPYFGHVLIVNVTWPHARWS